MAERYEPTGRLGRAIHSLEETAIALLLGLMTLLTFVAVVLRYVFNDQLIWSLEVILILFAWLVIFGVSYGFKVTAHLGVDALTNALPQRGKRVCAVLACCVTFAYAFLLLKGAWDYWAPFAALDRTSGAWFPTGFEKTRDQAWFVTDQVPPMRWLFGWLEPLINQGEEYEKLPRVVPYVILPFGCALILFRVSQAFVAVLRGTRKSLIVSHEAEEAVEEVAAAHRADAAPAAGKA
ncbi:C4-dicarboxylate ABC transporter permease [Jannaschia pagri]|uniref:TRAP transporter small permease protein n=1 Tax=Jannaschia pagri TaxID=2829797 RepID=A0ABQ4NPE4_9RHOB|nr:MULTISPECIES: TRAP transporter small permease [unclassified Jannaschia]GIT92431.1 C4-dicarboxylate ABC transporter permease [Jannaschia sp. AI_61]GIT96266.1 C4-dicarboxylate ABC transporter permease [Jannaschia sp. AI_62]